MSDQWSPRSHLVTFKAGRIGLKVQKSGVNSTFLRHSSPQTMEYDESVDREYSCSQWCPGFSPEEAIGNHLKIIQEKSAISSANLQHESHCYLTEQNTEETKYIFFPSTPESSKLLIFIHGGFWQNLDVASSTSLASVVVPRFCNFAAIGYDLCPSVTLATIVIQVRKALKSLMERYSHLDEIYLCGHSAGAHLSLMSLVFDGYEEELALSSADRDKVKGLILISGLYDVRPVCQTRANLVLNLSVDEAWRLSPIRCVGNLRKFNSSLKILVFVGEYDPPPASKQESQLNDALKGVVVVEKVLVKGKDHFSIYHDIGHDGYAITEKILEFLGLSGFGSLPQFADETYPR